MRVDKIEGQVEKLLGESKKTWARMLNKGLSTKDVFLEGKA